MKVNSRQMMKEIAVGSVVIGLMGLPAVQAVEGSHIALGVQAGVGFLTTEDSALGVTLSETDRLRGDEDVVFQGGVGVGYVISLRERCPKSCAVNWFPEAMVALNGYGFSGHFDEDVELYEDPSLNTYDYHLTVDSARLMADLSLTVVSWKEWSLSVLGGTGPSWNRVKFNETEKSGEGFLDLETHTENAWAWEVGAGVGYDITEDFKISLNYLYTDVGTIRPSNTVKGTNIPHAVITPEDIALHTNSILLGLQYNL